MCLYYYISRLGIVQSTVIFSTKSALRDLVYRFIYPTIRVVQLSACFYPQQEVRYYSVTYFYVLNSIRPTYVHVVHSAAFSSLRSQRQRQASTSS